jgi:hypothetical protein
MLKIVQLFGKYCSCHLQGECVVVGRELFIITADLLSRPVSILMFINNNVITI